MSTRASICLSITASVATSTSSSSRASFTNALLIHAITKKEYIALVSNIPAADRSQLHRLWLLRLVPDVPGGRWLCAGITFGLLLAVFWIAGVFTAEDSGRNTWPAALFFCAILAYIIPIFHYVTSRTEAAFDELKWQLDLDAATVERLRNRISAKSARWLMVNSAMGTLVWILQSRILAGSFSMMGRVFTTDSENFAMAVGPLPVWIFMFCAIHALVDNGRLFRGLTARVTIDLLDTPALNPFGRMAVSSTLVVIGAQALFPIMWLGGDQDPWTSIPGLFGTTLALCYLFIAPVWPLHTALRGAKHVELARLRHDINGLRTDKTAQGYGDLAPTLVYRREIASAAEWPFDLSIMSRLGLYLVIVPLTWIGAALIENLVDLFIS